MGGRGEEKGGSRFRGEGEEEVVLPCVNIGRGEKRTEKSGGTDNLRQPMEFITFRPIVLALALFTWRQVQTPRFGRSWRARRAWGSAGSPGTINKVDKWFRAGPFRHGK